MRVERAEDDATTLPGVARFVARRDGAPAGAARCAAYRRAAGYDRLAAKDGADADGAALAWVYLEETSAASGDDAAADALLAACLAHADAAGAAAVAADARAPDADRFAAAGFRPAFEARRWARPPDAAPPDAPDAAAYTVHPAGPGDVMEIVAYDAPRFGAARGPVLADLLARFPQHAFVAYARDGGDAAGFVLADDAAVGPLVADDARAARLLLYAALQSGAPAVARVPVVAPGAQALFADLGFQPTNEARVRVSRGDLPGRPSSQWAIRGWAWG